MRRKKYTDPSVGYTPDTDRWGEAVVNYDTIKNQNTFLTLRLFEAERKNRELLKKLEELEGWQSGNAAGC